MTTEAMPSNTYHPMDQFETLEDAPKDASDTREGYASISPPGQYEPSGAGSASAGPQTRASSSPFDPQDEYRKLLDVVAAEDKRGTDRRATTTARDLDVYQSLLSRERRVLDTVDRVVNDDIQKRATASSLAGMPVHELCFRTISSLRGLFDDLLEAATARSWPDAIAALSNQHRMPFIGIALVVLGLVLAAINVL